MNKFEYINLIKELPEPRYIYGAGKAGHIILELCNQNDIKIAGFCVTDIKDNKKSLDGYPVISFKELMAKVIAPSIIVGVVERGEKIIEKNLKSAGISEFLSLPDSILMLNSREKKRYNSPIIEVTPKVGCSVNCRFCPQNLLLSRYYKDNSNRKSEMSFDVFKIFLEKIPANTILDWSGFVEPFLNPAAIDMMEYANSKGIEQNLFTTLQGLDYKTYHRVLQIPFDEVVLHTADRFGYANIPITDLYLTMIKEMVSAKKIDGTPFLTSANCQFEPSEKVTAITSGKLKIYCEMSDRAGNLENDDKKLASKHLMGKITCSRSRLLNHNVLLPDGSLVLCCNDFGLEYVLGNLNTDTYDDIQNSDTMKRIIAEMNSDSDKTLICRNCMFAAEQKNE
jgi:radical SAM protein with 4Fe4S-binding SPASM domain